MVEEEALAHYKVWKKRLQLYKTIEWDGSIVQENLRLVPPREGAKVDRAEGKDSSPASTRSCGEVISNKPLTARGKQ